MSYGRLLLGAISAFVAQCAIAVSVGNALKDLPHGYVEFAAGILFLYFSAQFWLESRKAEVVKTHSENSIASVFSLFFVAELGDVSQLAVASRSVQAESPMSVFIGESAAMAAIAIRAVFAGRIISARVRPAALQKIASALFFLMGFYLLIEAFMPLVNRAIGF